MSRDTKEIRKAAGTGSKQFYLEDLHVGLRFTSGNHTIGEDEIVEYALKYDPQPFHLDDEAARGTLFGSLAASGWHVASVTMRLQVESELKLAGGIIGAGGEFAWPNPTRPGDILRVESEILEIRPSRSRPERGMVKMRSETRNQRDEVVFALTVRLVVPRRIV